MTRNTEIRFFSWVVSFSPILSGTNLYNNYKAHQNEPLLDSKQRIYYYVFFIVTSVNKPTRQFTFDSSYKQFLHLNLLLLYTVQLFLCWYTQ